jgi:hypothetical protein
MTSREIALNNIKRVAFRLGRLRERVVFLGGSIVPLLITDPAAPDSRPTKDVDVAVNAASLREVYQLENELRQLGFLHAQMPGDPTCRWTVDSCVVDVIPVGRAVNAYNDLWSPSAIEHAAILDIGDNITIRHVTAPYFIAIKLETFEERGAGDYMMSQDIADIVQVLDGRTEIAVEVRSSEADLAEYIRLSFRSLLQTDGFLDSLPAHLLPDAASQARQPIILQSMETICV